MAGCTVATASSPTRTSASRRAPKEQRQPINAGHLALSPHASHFEIFAHGTSNPVGRRFQRPRPGLRDGLRDSAPVPHNSRRLATTARPAITSTRTPTPTSRRLPTIGTTSAANPHGGNNKSDAAGGGHAHAGAMIYLGGTWPRGYRDQIFMNNIHGQRLNVDILKPEGLGLRRQPRPDFLLTGDRASQNSSISATGPTAMSG